MVGVWAAFYPNTGGNWLANVFVRDLVVKNPLSPVEHKGGAGVKNELFEYGLDQFIRGLM